MAEMKAKAKAAPKGPTAADVAAEVLEVLNDARETNLNDATSYIVLGPAFVRLKTRMESLVA